MSKYELSTSNINSPVVSHFDLDTSGGYDVSGVGQFVEGKSRPLCSLHRHEVTRFSTIDQKFYAGVEGVVSTCANAPSNREQTRMLTFGSFHDDTPKCRILSGFVDAEGKVQLFSTTSASRSLNMLFRPTWAVLCSWRVTDIVTCCLDLYLFEACLILTVHVLFLWMVVDSYDNCAPSVLARHSCSNAGLLGYPDDPTDYSDVHQCMRVALPEAWRLYPDSLAMAEPKPLELQSESAWA